jgi:hypothetical protein
MAPIFLERHAGGRGFSDMELSTQYRKFAEDCRRLAQFAKTDEHRQVLREMEIVWARLAEEVERQPAVIRQRSLGDQKSTAE